MQKVREKMEVWTLTYYNVVDKITQFNGMYNSLKEAREMAYSILECLNEHITNVYVDSTNKICIWKSEHISFIAQKKQLIYTTLT